MKRLLFVLFVVGLVFCTSIGYGQYRIGPKVVGMANYHFMYSKEYLLDISNRINYGGAVGLSLTYEVTKTVTVNIDGLYANRGRTLKGGFNKQFKHVARYNFIDVPVMFRYKMGQTDKYAWFITGGGNMSYFLGGRGTINSFEYDEAAAPAYDYVIKKGTETIAGENELIIANGNSIMVGLDIGAGMIFPMLGNTWLTVEVKYQHGHSWLGEDAGIDVGLVEYYEDFRTTISSLTIGVSYQLARTLGEFRKGKTTYGKSK